MNDNNIEILSPLGEPIVNNNKGSDLKTEELLIHAVYEKEKFQNITHKFIGLYERRYGLDQTVALVKYEELLKETIASKLDFFNTTIGVKTLRKKQAGTARDLKKRWYDAAEKSLNKRTTTLIKKELKEIKDRYILYETLPIEGMQTPEDIIDIRLGELKEWVSSILNPITEYPYLNELSESKIKSAFKHDIILCITEILQNEYDHDIKKIVSATPGMIAPGMFIPQKTGRRVNHLHLTKEEDSSSYSTRVPYTAKDMEGTQMDFGYLFLPEVDYDPSNQLAGFLVELSDDSTAEKASKKLYLDRLDLDIIREVYRDLGGTSTGARFKLYDLILALKLAPSGKNYKKVEEKLLKLPCYTFFFSKTDSDKEYERTSFNLFSQTKVFKDENGDKVVDIYYSRAEIVEKATTAMMYKNELKKLQLSHSIDLAYFLEGQRRFQTEKGYDLKDKVFRYDFDQLRMYINFGKRKTVKEISDFIEEACTEISNNQFIIKEYTIGCGFLNVKFYEGTEKIKSLINKTAILVQHL